MGELRAHKFDKRNVSPFALDQQVVAGAQALNSLIEPRNKAAGSMSNSRLTALISLDKAVGYMAKNPH